MAQSPKNPGTPPPIKPSKKKSTKVPSNGAAGGNWGWLILIAMVLGLLLVSSQYSAANPIHYGSFVRLLFHPKDSLNIKKIIFVGVDRIRIDLVEGAPLEDVELKTLLSKKNTFLVTRARIEDTKTTDRLNALVQSGKVDWEQQEDPYAGLGSLMFFFLPILLFLVFFFFILPKFRDPMGGGFLSNYIKSPAKRYEKNKSRTTFDDVAGTENAKAELSEIVEFLKSPEKFQALGAMIPKGVLLVGPPGTGKTLLAKAVAGEAGVPFFSINGSEFIQMFVGVGASRVRDMFKTAKENAPCILFIDEIDAVGRMRGAGLGGGSDEREQTLNQILSEMDGFQPSETVIVVAATNRPDVLDSALLRPGRFDRHVTVDRPTVRGRVEILKVHTRTKPLANDVNLEVLARRLIGMTGADLKNLANEAAIVATRSNKTKIGRVDFEVAIDRVLIGPKREEILTTEDKRRTAYHEAGHALVTWLMPGSERPQKVSIIPRGQSLGVTWTAPDEDKHHHGEDYYKRYLVRILGGRAADRVIYGQPYSGAESDLKRGTSVARQMVAHWGMSSRIGPMAFKMGEEHVFLGRELSEARDYSDGMANLIDEEIQRVLLEADEKAVELLKENVKYLEVLVDELLLKEELIGEEMETILFHAGLASAILPVQKEPDPPADDKPTEGNTPDTLEKGLAEIKIPTVKPS
ncbi:MAG: ATP-dependent zinc metalloprotease FtsH [Planctomycetota bacterium]|nr:ATP-dependent zinc metalloprotease FtsH [Planctomycetota bacterium]